MDLAPLDDLVGIPWSETDEGESGTHCWGLVVLAYQRVLGVVLDDFAERHTSASDPAARALAAEERANWRRLEPGQERPMDVVLMRCHPYHVGVVVEHGLMLHIPEGGEAVVESYLLGRWGNLIEGVHRHSSQDGAGT